jgi:hypothetical protein
MRYDQEISLSSATSSSTFNRHLNSAGSILTRAVTLVCPRLHGHSPSHAVRHLLREKGYMPYTDESRITCILFRFAPAFSPVDVCIMKFSLSCGLSTYTITVFIPKMANVSLDDVSSACRQVALSNTVYEIYTR